MSEQVKFKIGQIVKLKSGGPDMTVQSKGNEAGTRYSCQWFAGKKLENGTFPTESLQSVAKEDK
jgi:uncharacterized protein YodC (DUF2158 family)